MNTIFPILHSKVFYFWPPKPSYLGLLYKSKNLNITYDLHKAQNIFLKRLLSVNKSYLNYFARKDKNFRYRLFQMEFPWLSQNFLNNFIVCLIAFLQNSYASKTCE